MLQVAFDRSVLHCRIAHDRVKKEQTLPHPTICLQHLHGLLPRLLEHCSVRNQIWVLGMGKSALFSKIASHPVCCWCHQCWQFFHGSAGQFVACLKAAKKDPIKSLIENIGQFLQILIKGALPCSCSQNMRLNLSCMCFACGGVNRKLCGCWTLCRATCKPSCSESQRSCQTLLRNV